MKASILDLRRRMPDVLRALERNEPVTILHRGKTKGILLPAAGASKARPASEHAAFGLWKDRPDMENVADVVHRLRRGRFDAL
jgi:antitoxin (DNA-binding transcriptional repressor) of toxin-antitoxin stability system